LTAPGRDCLSALRTALAAAGYTAEAIAPARRLLRFVPVDDEPALVRLFALGQAISIREARAAVSPAVLADLETAGLLHIEGDVVIANYCLVPHDGLLVAGDRSDGARDLVHPFSEPSLTLARLTPRTPTRSMLDLGTGSGVLALLGASHCDRVTAADINPRSLMFARFNAEINDASNVELLEGSWFEPVAGRRFDLIVGNPPYVISPDHEFTYRDSGLAPGALLELLSRDAAAHLNDGGLAIFLCSWAHSSEDDWAVAPGAAVRDTGCDALILRQRTVDPLDHAVSWNTPPVRSLSPETFRETVGHWLQYYRAIGAELISFGAVVLRRRPSEHQWLTAFEAPTAFGDRAPEQLVRAIDGHDLSRSLEDSALLAARFSLPAGIDVSQRFQRRAAGFVARPAVVSLEGGLGVRAAIDPDALDAVFACDGSRTLSAIVDGLAARRGLQLDALADVTVRAARELLAYGLLEGCPPRSTSGQPSPG
jgi:methylase of polypeptide subunit release factors